MSADEKNKIIEELQAKLEASSRINAELKQEKQEALKKAVEAEARLAEYQQAEQIRIEAQQKAQREAEFKAEVEKRVQERLNELNTIEEVNPIQTQKPGENGSSGGDGEQQQEEKPDVEQTLIRKQIMDSIGDI